jgi:hypothetical protein
MHPGHRVSLFDDEAGPPLRAPSSRGIIVALDMRRHSARLVHQYRRPADTLAESEGSVQALPGGDQFVGFGSQPAFSEFTSAGALVFDARLPVDDGSYREYRFPWSATPRARPAVIARRGAQGRVSVYASWNGATTVARWQVLAGSSAGSLSPVRTAPSTGFETRIAVGSPAPVFAVRAIDARGRVLSRSAAVNAS